ncbi:MAG: hypothetical protein JHC39_11045 [Lentimicrobium sp.]|jgi:hypothetical protein|nr:hypothetical protein [Lentimicrobium sp.]
MKTYQIDLLNPKAAKLLQDLADLKLISIKETKKQDFTDIVSKLRKKASSNAPSLEEISKEVEMVRTERYAKNR